MNISGYLQIYMLTNNAMKNLITQPPIYEALNRTIQRFPEHEEEIVQTEIETLLDYCLDGMHNDSEKLLATIMINSLRKHIVTDNTEDHIYLKKYEITQIELFRILIEQFQFVKYSHRIANQIICDKIGGNLQAVILDVGMGQGVQLQNLVKMLDSHSNLKKLTIIGIEPFKDALDQATSIFNNLNESAFFEIEFIAWEAFIQDIEKQELCNRLDCYKGELIINSSLALHHIQTIAERENTLKNLHALDPLAMVIIEPNSDHFSPDLNIRFENCYRHFHHIFQVIDKLDISQKERNGLKMFFGREIEDIIAKPEELRFERHEPASHWSQRLKQCGFSLNTNISFKLPHIDDITLDIIDESYLGFTFKDETILSVFHAEPAYRSAPSEENKCKVAEANTLQECITLEEKLRSMDPINSVFTIRETYQDHLLIYFNDAASIQKIMKIQNEMGIDMLDFSEVADMEVYFRLNVGTTEHNKQIAIAFKTLYNSYMA